MIVLFGLKNCDTCRRARKWLDAQSLAYRFVDVRDMGVEGDLIDRWIDGLGYDSLVNRRGTTWRNLPPSVRENLDAERARELMMAHPALIKRPIWDVGGQLFLGFSPDTQKQIVAKAIAAGDGG